MTNHQIEELTAVLDTSLRESDGAQGYGMFRHLILLLAKGQSVSPERPLP